MILSLGDLVMKSIYISYLAPKNIINYIKNSGCNIHLVPSGGRTYNAVDSHPDIYFCKMGVTEHPYIFRGNPAEIGAAYPQNIKFNAVCLDRYFIHNIKYTSPALLSEARETGLEFINVNQGYTKCSCVVVDGHSIITSDEGIYRALNRYSDIETLKIRAGFVNLEGFDYGFLGGASGRIGNEIIFSGNLSAHPDYSSISQFIEARGLAVKYFPEYPLTDIGSILTDF